MFIKGLCIIGVWASVMLLVVAFFIRRAKTIGHEKFGDEFAELDSATEASVAETDFLIHKHGC